MTPFSFELVAIAALTVRLWFARISVGIWREEAICREFNLNECLARVVGFIGTLFAWNTVIIGRNEKLNIADKLSNRKYTDGNGNKVVSRMNKRFSKESGYTSRDCVAVTVAHIRASVRHLTFQLCRQSHRV